MNSWSLTWLLQEKTSPDFFVVSPTGSSVSKFADSQRQLFFSLMSVTFEFWCAIILRQGLNKLNFGLDHDYFINKFKLSLKKRKINYITQSMRTHKSTIHNLDIPKVILGIFLKMYTWGGTFCFAVLFPAFGDEAAKELKAI